MCSLIWNGYVRVYRILNSVLGCYHSHIAFRSNLGAVVVELLRIKSVFMDRHRGQTVKLPETCLMQCQPQI